MIEADPNRDKTPVPVPQKPGLWERAGLKTALLFEIYLDRLPNKEKPTTIPQAYSPRKKLGLALAGVAVVASLAIGGIALISSSQKVNEVPLSPTPAVPLERSNLLIGSDDRLRCEGQICNYVVRPNYSLAVMINGLKIYYRPILLEQALVRFHLMAANPQNYPMIFITAESYKNNPQALKNHQVRLNQLAFEANIFGQANQISGRLYDVLPPRPVSFPDLVSYTGFSSANNPLDMVNSKDQRLRHDLARQLSLGVANAYKIGVTNIDLTTEMVLTPQETEDISNLLPISIDS